MEMDPCDQCHGDGICTGCRGQLDDRRLDGDFCLDCADTGICEKCAGVGLVVRTVTVTIPQNMEACPACGAVYAWVDPAVLGCPYCGP